MLIRLFTFLLIGFALFPALHAQALDAGVYAPAETRDACLSPAQRSRIVRRLAEAERLLAATEATYAMSRPDTTVRDAVQFAHPLRWSSRINGCFTNSVRTAHVDHNPLAGSLDYACGSRTYNGHHGTDIMPWPFPWWAMANDHAEVIAAASGIIILKEDGHSDQHCDHPDSTWNAVYLQHEDGSTSWYGHLKRGSLTAKSIGDPVSQGEVLGIVGSSGYSDGPHLHFEVHDALGKVQDPFRGGCNSLHSASLWESQEPYRQPSIQAIGLHASVPSLAPCVPEDVDLPDWRDRFISGERAFVGVYIKDPRPGQLLAVRVLDARGKRIAVWTHEITESSYAGWVLFALDMAGSTSYGTWLVQVEFEDEIRERTFQYCYKEAQCACPTPTMPHSSTLGAARYGLYWGDIEDADTYQIQGGSMDSLPVRMTVSGTSMDLPSLAPETAYSWRVRAMCGTLPSAWSAWERIDVPSSSAIESYPAPVHGERPRYGTVQESTRVYDLSGRLTWQGLAKRIPWVELQAGWYWVQDGETGAVQTVWHQP